MTFSMHTPIKNLDGTPVVLKSGVEEKPLTLRKILTETLLFEDEGDARASSKDKIRRIKLALRVAAEDEPNFSLSEQAWILARVDKLCSALLVYRIREILDPASLDDQPKQIARGEAADFARETTAPNSTRPH